jgi:hypothetical protein
MGDTTKKPPPFLAWGLWREQRKAGSAMEWRELGPIFLNTEGSGGDCSGGMGHFKSIPTSGWNYRFTIRRYEDGPPPLPILRKAAPQQKQPPPGELDDEANGLFSDE